MGGSSLFDTVPRNDYLGLFREGKTHYSRVVGLLEFSKKDVAKASNVPLQSVRYDRKIPKELEDRLKEWAVALATVAEYFKDTQKTLLWFRIPNPLLGNIAPREMLRVGRFNKLHRFILSALSENKRDAA